MSEEVFSAEGDGCIGGDGGGMKGVVGYLSE
jgi:hypothetical protein